MVRTFLALLVLLTLPQVAVWGQDPPIIALAGEHGASVRGGPDEVHYETSQLAPGAEIEIYRLDPGGWCAIRPPEDSFSLVRAAAIESLDEEQGIATIGTDDEQCWIGTMMGAVDEPMWQLKLKRGEKVRLLGSITSSDDPSQVEWYQIAPPSGEFRWVALSDLDDESQQQVSAYFAPSETPAARPGERTILKRDDSAAPIAQAEPVDDSPSESPDVALASYDDPRKNARQTQEPEARWRPPQRRRAFGDVRVASAQTPAVGSTFVAPDSSRRMDHSLATGPSTQPPMGVPTVWPRAYQELDLRLSMEILKDPPQWKLDSLAADVMKTKSMSSPSEAPIADHLLNKIRQFQLIQDAGPRGPGNAGGSSVQGVVAVVGQDAIPLTRPSAELDEKRIDYTKTFDAHGWLNELVRDEGMGQTTYVLQDDQGKITHLIAATPGLNLHRYLKTKVGIVGQKGFHQGMNLDHVTAERVVNLDTVNR